MELNTVDIFTKVISGSVGSGYINIFDLLSDDLPVQARFDGRRYFYVTRLPKVNRNDKIPE